MRHIFVLLMSSALVLSAYAVNGIAVTELCGDKTGDGEYFLGNYATQRQRVGKILFQRLENNIVVASDTLGGDTYQADTVLCLYPRFNFDASKVVFYRWDYPHWDEATGSWQSDRRYISVIDTDGTNLRDLVTMDAPGCPDNPSQSCFDFGIMISWPVGDWIYYRRPRTSEIWKVNYRDPTQHSLAYAYPSISYSWMLNATGDKAVVNDACWDNSYICLTPHFFPPAPSEPFPYRGCGNCNACISPSGDKFGYYDGGEHGIFVFKNFVSTGSTADCEGEVRYTVNDFRTWAGSDETKMGISMGDFATWSNNSDKWAVTNIKDWRYSGDGTNLLLVNWADQEAVLATDNVFRNYLPDNDPRKAIAWECRSGDFHVITGQEAGKYEDASGEWIPVPGYVAPTESISPRLNARTTVVSSSAAGNSIVLRDTMGRTVRTISNGSSSVDRTSLQPGLYVMTRTVGSTQTQTRIAVK